MHTHDRVHGLDRLAADGEPGRACAVRLRDGAVQGGQALEVGLEAGAEGRVEGVAGAPERVAADFGGGEQLEGRRAGRLQLVRHVGVPELEPGEGRGVGPARRVVVDHWGARFQDGSCACVCMCGKTNRGPLPSRALLERGSLRVCGAGPSGARGRAARGY